MDSAREEPVGVWGVRAEGTRWEYSDPARARDRYLHEVVVSTENGWHDIIGLYEAERSAVELAEHEVDDGMWILVSAPINERMKATVETPSL